MFTFFASENSSNICEDILYVELGNSRVRVWDVLILVPNLLFLLFLIVRFNRTRLKFRATNSPIFIAFYSLVVINVIVSVSRCFIALSLQLADVPIGLTEKILWVVVRFTLLATEMSVVIFGLAFGHLDSRRSIKYVLIVTSLLSLAFSTTQGSLEILSPDDNFPTDVHIFDHGGIIFWFITSFLFSSMYLIILILPWTRVRERLVLPIKHSFYLYTFLLLLINLTQCVASGLLNFGMAFAGLCATDAISIVYFTLFTPLVYYSFLSDFFSVSQPSIMFSYKTQVDDAMEDDNVPLPHQQSFSSLRTDSDYIFQGNSVYDSTHFDRTNNALYVASLQSPDSIPEDSIGSSGSLMGQQ